MQHRLLLLIALYLFGPFYSKACSCVYIATFCESLSFQDSIYHDLIVYGAVTNVQNNGMEVSIIEQLYGQEARSSIFIKRGNGANCGEDTNQFKRGQELILALYLAYNEETQQEDQYWLSICGVNYLFVENGRVIGKIAPGVSILPFKKFIQSTTCPAFRAFQPSAPSDPEFKVYPNPVRATLFVKPSDQVSDFSYALYDLQGRLLLRGIRKEVEAEELVSLELPLNQIGGGIHILRLDSKMGSENLKVLILPY